MKKRILFVILLVLCVSACQKKKAITVYNNEFIRSRNVQCGPESTILFAAGIFPLGSQNKANPEINHPRYLSAGKLSGLPPIVANDNRITAGTKNDGILNLNLEVKWGDFRMETKDRPGLKMVAIGEVGKAASIPSPLIRIVEGTLIKVKITNILADSTVTVYGLQKRPYTKKDSLLIPPGESAELSFEAGKPGTYMYWLKLGKGHKKGLFAEEDEQLAGAFIIDPKEGSPKDRVFVMNIFSNQNKQEGANPEWVESLTINGRSWPFTERIIPAVGDTLNWRVINASTRNHPMHLHGFYYDVLERGDTKASTIFTKDQIKTVVTETLNGRNTMAMQWIPKRPGNWLFHCHLSFHVSSEVRLPGAEISDLKGAHQHMAGLVLGIQVKNGGSDLISKGEEKHMTLFAHQADENSMSMNLDAKSPEPSFKPGPLLVLKQYQTTRITVKNEMTVPTSIHWHGLEIDSWSDGVPNWSASDGRSSPAIEPGGEFTYKLSLMRAGTFVYHSHLNDVNQLTKGMYGPMIVLGENEIYNPKLDHFYILGWKNPDPQTDDDVDINGWDKIPVQQAKTGETHRIRLINIGPAGNVSIHFTKNGKKYIIKNIAKDGADLPASQQTKLEKSPKLYVGEAADFSFTPEESGTYELKFNFWPAKWTQVWEVSDQ